MMLLLSSKSCATYQSGHLDLRHGWRAGLTLGLVIGSVLLALSGAIHLQLWSMGYRTIPTIGPLFLIQGIAGFLFASVLLLSRRLLIVVMAGGFMLATIGGLLFSVCSDCLASRTPWRRHTQDSPSQLRDLEPYSLPLSASYLRVVTTEQTKNARSSISELPFGAVADTRPDLGDRQLLNR